ncbi:DNA-binding transcriptional LysR family regulator [Paenibacillus shirakamiensis]|uniref:DNA-binding transcriptional LysR family regulator n=1 Tax=Paenibacillus shirakamiensis TaxID=1265935 RepID=A0ABS4JG08_9BACL|nr:LysR family transcriptional regulator [Paenibacillus shirakamiensis]MBP2000652.1 DNA-binding transcriptional LysR family regulator [Paenibacillus shirakamiensis]
MNYIKFKIVVLIDKYKKVTDVARELNLKQPTVTFHMKSLEEELGLTLFEMRRGRVILTEAGKAFYSYAYKITALTEEALHAMEDFDNLERGTLRIGGGLMPGNYYLPVAAGQFMRKFPGLHLEMTIRPDEEVIRMLQQAEIDVAILHTSDEPLPEQMQCDLLNRDDVVLIYSEEHSFNALRKIEVNQIAQERFIQHAEGSFIRRYSERWAAANQINLWNSVTMDSLEAVKMAVQAKTGISFFTKRGLENMDMGGRIRTAPLPGNLLEGPVISLVYRKDRPMTAAAKEFIKYAKNI